jgi:aspartyl-tRNA(Asn)/glutamyl-tRNA(Gln) amidotransferase subunit A
VADAPRDGGAAPAPAAWLDRPAHAQARALRAGQVTARALTDAALARIREQEPALNAYITLLPDEARAQADDADARLRRGDAAPLTGVPVAVKDLISIAGIETTAGSQMLRGFRPIVDATVVAKLRAAGAVLLGKANLDEFAMGSSTEHSAFGPTRNPWDLDRVPGGSSGGSAATVAAAAVPLALGTDTGGSIRQPAALCGILGLKPTYGRVSRFGVVAFASSLEQVGPFARDAEDLGALLAAIAGHDPLDATTAPLPVPDYAADLGRGIEGLRVGVPQELLGEGLEPGVRAAVEAAIDQLAGLGAHIDRDVALPSVGASLPVYYLIAPSEASANLARYDGVKYGYSAHDGPGMWDDMEQTRGRGFGAEVKRRIMIGTYALSAGYYDAYYLKAQKVRTLIRREFEAALATHDLLLTPTTPGFAFRLGEKLHDPLAMYLSDLFTLPVNIAGLPAASIPCGFAEGLPVGMQLVGRAFDEGTILRAAHAYATVTDWHLRRPSAIATAGATP